MAQKTGATIADKINLCFDAVDVNTVKATNIDHPVVSIAVPTGAVFTDTVYDDTNIQSELDLKVVSLVGGNHITIDSTDPQNPIVNATGSVDAVVGGNNVTIDATNPTQPIINVPDMTYDDTALTADILTNSTDILTKENVLGDPTLDDQILSSKSDGTRSWVQLPTGAAVIDDLTTGGSTISLSAEQGVVLKGLSDVNVTDIGDNTSAIALNKADIATNTSNIA